MNKAQWVVITYTISSFCTQRVAGPSCPQVPLGWKSKMTIRKAGSGFWLGAQLGLFTEAPVCVLSLWLGPLTTWQLGSKCPKSEHFKSPKKKMQNVLCIGFRSHTVSLLPYFISQMQVTEPARCKKSEVHKAWIMQGMIHWGSHLWKLTTTGSIGEVGPYFITLFTRGLFPSRITHLLSLQLSPR